MTMEDIIVILSWINYSLNSVINQILTVDFAMREQAVLFLDKVVKIYIDVKILLDNVVDVVIEENISIFKEEL